MNNSNNTVVLRFEYLNRGCLKPEINYSLSGIRKGCTANRFLHKLVQCLMTYLKFSTIWWSCWFSYVVCTDGWKVKLPTSYLGWSPQHLLGQKWGDWSINMPSLPRRLGLICLGQKAAGHCPRGVSCLGLFAVPCGGGRTLRLCVWQLCDHNDIAYACQEARARS